MPTTPSWKSGSNTQSAGGRLLAFLEQRLGDLQRLLAHVAFDALALAVDGVERARQFVGRARRRR